MRPSPIVKVFDPRTTMGTPFYPPVHFFAEADVVAGGEGTINSEALSNRTGKSIEIHEIRLAARIPPQEQMEAVDVASFIRVRMSAMGKPITNSFVPMWLLGKIEQYPSQVSAGTLPGNEAASFYIWRLSQPMFLPPGAQIEAQFQHSGALRFTARAQIGLAGRYVAARKTTSAIPYASAYVSRGFEYAEVGFDESSESDLVNKTGHDLNIDRLTGRVLITRAIADGFSGAVVDNDSYNTSIITGRINTSNNLPILRDYQNFLAVFGNSRSMDIPHVMEPNDFLRVGIRKTAGATPILQPYTTWTGQASVAFLGWREEGI
jgi:hypothetical protein